MGRANVLCKSTPNDASVRIGGHAGVRGVRHGGRAPLLLHIRVIPQQLVQTWINDERRINFLLEILFSPLFSSNEPEFELKKEEKRKKRQRFTAREREQHQHVEEEELHDVHHHSGQGDLQGAEMRIYGENVDEFQGAGRE